MTATARNAERYRRAEQRFQLPMLLLSLLLLPALLVPLLDRHLRGALRLGFGIIDVVSFCCFVAEYVVLLSLAPDRWRHVRTHPLDLALVVLPVLRPLRALRLLRIARVGLIFTKLAERIRRSLILRGITFVAAFAVAMVLVAAVVELALERDAPGSTIRTLPDALWWALSMITPAGYGTHRPVTSAGRALAVPLTITGVALVGVLTAAVAAWFVRSEERSESESADMRAELRELKDMLARLGERIDPPASE